MTVELRPAEAAILAALTRAAANGKVCPTNAELCNASGYAAPNTSSALVMRLQDLGLIQVHRTQSTRRVTIVSTGKSTAPVTRARSKGNLDTLAGHVSEGCSLTEAGRRMGVSVQRASQLWRRICDGLGSQAR